METLKKIVTNQYFPAAAVLTAVLAFWAVGLLGGLSLLHNNQPPLATLTWLLFVYFAAVLSPLAGLLAAASLIRRWRRNRAAFQALERASAPASSDRTEAPAKAATSKPATAARNAQATPPQQHTRPAPPRQPTQGAAKRPAPAAGDADKHPHQPGRKQAA
ncbi:hypothetical protein ASF72_11115 [Arthrobacter sp. Leaf141]|uniref:hypothetical protein n=1 Tax=Micrococcaceae TaxID=1268 RepID=UPI0006F3037B|nr:MULTISPECIES: hypothetical protein [Micrococcaceae]KQR02172.1 hypothetical protein ASF72_11115 [Arthrobacter sp. Leaf141]